jgi:hypothetical protein
MPTSFDLVDNFRINVGRFYDGETARERHVSVAVEPDGLVIEDDGEAIVKWPSTGLNLLGDYIAGKWFTIRCGYSAARLQMPPRMYDRLLREYGPLKRRGLSPDAKRSWLMLLIFLFLTSAGIVFVLPNAAEAIASFVSPANAKNLGRQNFDNYVARRERSRGGIRFCADSGGLKALSKLARILGGVTQDIEPNITIVRRRSVNAFSLGGGHAVLYSGLIDYVRNDAELVGVIAHEMGHGAGRHRQRRMTETTTLLSFAEFLFNTWAPSSIGYTLTDKGPKIPFHSQHREREADRLSILWLQAMSVDPAAVGDMMLRIAADEGEPDFLDSHPTYAERSVMFHAATMKGYPLLAPNEWQALKSICRTTTKTAPVSPPEPS